MARGVKLGQHEATEENQKTRKRNWRRPEKMMPFTLSNGNSFATPQGEFTGAETECLLIQRLLSPIPADRYR